MKGSSITAVILVAVLGTLAGCNSNGGGGGNNGNPNNLTQPQAKQLGSAVSTDVSNALSSATGIPAVPLDFSSRDHMIVALRGNSRADTVSKPEVVTCGASGCTVYGTYGCPDGGSTAVSGNISSTSGTSVSGTLTFTPSSCSDGILDITGNPDITVGLQLNDDGITTTVTVTLT